MNPANAKFLCGAECGIAAIGTASAGTEHWSAFGAASTIVTSGPTPMRSTRCFRFNPSAAASTNQHTFATAIASPATLVARFYLYFASLPNVSSMIFMDLANSAGVYYDVGDGKLKSNANGGSAKGTGFTVTTGVWYRCDMKAVMDATRTVDFMLDGVADTQASFATTASTGTGIRFGAVTAMTADFYIDDVIASGTASDYPIGDGTGFGLYPVADRTNSAANPTDGNKGHLYSAVGDFGKGSGGATNLGAQNAEATSWQSLQNPLSTSIGTNFIADLLGSSAEHLMWEFDNLPILGSVNGVMLTCTTHSAAATANEFRIVMSNGTAALSYPYGGLDLSETTITVPVIVLVGDASGSAWTANQVNASTFGLGDSTDVNPDVFLDGIVMEVDLTTEPHRYAGQQPAYPQMLGR